MATDYGLKLAQQMFPNVKPLPWPPNQPIAEIEKDSDGKYSVFLFGVTQTYVTKGVLRHLCKEENRYTYNADQMEEAALFDTLDDAEIAYTSYCKGNERMIGGERLVINDTKGIVKEYFK